MRIITAIGNEKLKEILERKGFELCSYDIQYKEGVLEFIEGKGFADYIVINYNLPGEIDFQELVFKIMDINPLIKIITVNVDKAVKISKVYKCFESNNLEMIVQFLILDSDSEEALKQQYKGKIVTILGTNGVGKSVFSINLANVLKCEKKLIIDFDVLNNSLHYLLGINDYTNRVQTNIRKNILDYSYKQSIIHERDLEYNVDMSPMILKTNFNVDLISGVNLIFDTKSQINPETIKHIILKLKQVYEVIIIDTSSQCFESYNKEIMKISEELIFLSGANLYEVQKAKVLLKKYTEEYKIDKDKFYIVFNKCSKKSIDEELLREFFREYKVLGKIKLRDYYEYIINKNKAKQRKISKDMKLIEKRGGFGGKSIREYTRPKYINRKLRKSAKHIS